jgi:hypothetical protein
MSDADDRVEIEKILLTVPQDVSAIPGLIAVAFVLLAQRDEAQESNEIWSEVAATVCEAAGVDELVRVPAEIKRLQAEIQRLRYPSQGEEASLASRLQIMTDVANALKADRDEARDTVDQLRIELAELRSHD